MAEKFALLILNIFLSSDKHDVLFLMKLKSPTKQTRCKQMLLKSLRNAQMAYMFPCQRDSFENEAYVIIIYDLLKKKMFRKHAYKEKH